MELISWNQLCWLPICLLSLLTLIHTVSSENRVVCYYTNWSVYRPGTAKFSPQNINPYLCTHLIYAFGGFTKENSLKPFDKYQDIEKGGYAKFTGLKTYNKNLKTMLAIGGWNEGSSRFSPMVANPDRRKEFVKNSIKFLRQNHFDGLDLDWEYPSFRDGGKAHDKQNYAQLVQELREEFDRETEKTGRPRLLLTMAVPAGIEYINKGYDIPKLTKYLDWMNILSYDYHSAFEPAVNHHSPLYPLEEESEYNYDVDLNIDHTIKHYLKLGADPNKLVLGIPTYGRSYTLFNADANELGAPADGPGDMGDATRENGYLAFYEICENLKENDWKIVQPNPEAMGPYAYKGNQWVSYDDDLIAKKKSEYVVDNNLGGIMFWSIDNDDFRGHCYNKPYPLIEAAKEALIAAAISKTDSNLVSGKRNKKPTIGRSRSRTSPPSNAIKKEVSATTARIQNSGGRQGGDDIPNNNNISRKRIRSKPRNEEPPAEEVKPRVRGGGRRRKTTTTAPSTTVTTTTESILQRTTPVWTTPSPPSTPDQGGDFKCEEDGFFPHPRDCKKYYWCLSGPADLGIIAHSFTCPAGLYFNKAADSCDYTQNVLCKKNIKTTTSTTSTPTTTAAPSSTTSSFVSSFYSTRRPAPKITAATSKTTFLYTTTSTTPEPEYYDEEYEYDDDEIENTPRRGEFESEEDPKVIKELIDLIKKVGGIEELEKYLKLQEDGTMSVTNSGSTTPATISRSLYEKVLSRATAKANPQSRNSLTYSAISRNRGPQNAGLRTEKQNEEEDSEESNKRGRPKYTTITRQRASTEKNVETDDEDDDEQEEVVSKSRQFPSRKNNNQPEYVTIKRARPTASVEVEEETGSRTISRGRQRGIPGEDKEDEVSGTQSPEYATIRRSRPSTEETTTSKYTTIQRRRPATEENIGETEVTVLETETTNSKRRSTTLAPAEQETFSPSTALPLISTTGTPKEEVEEITESVINNKLGEIESSTILKSTSEEPSAVTNVSTSSAVTNSSTPSTTTSSSSDKSSPQLFRPRPFASRTRSTTTPPTQTTENLSVSTTKKVGDLRSNLGVNKKLLKFNSNSSNSNRPGGSSISLVPSTTESERDIQQREDEEEEQKIIREEEARKRIRNRGKSKFSVPTSTYEPTVSRKRRPQTNIQSVTSDYEYEDEELHRAYRPTLLADLSSLTSVDIAFQQNGGRKHIRRRPVATPSSSKPASTVEATVITSTTETSLKTGPRTIPLTRKLISENQFSKNSKRVSPITITSPSGTANPSNINKNLFKSRPAFSVLRTSTTQSSIEEEEEESETTSRFKNGRSFPKYSSLTRTTTTEKASEEEEQVNTDNNSNEIENITEVITTAAPQKETKEEKNDSTESQSEKEFKTAKPDDEIDEVETTTINNINSEKVTTSTLKNDLKSTTISSTVVTTEEAVYNKINRTRKIVIANRRFRTTTGSPAKEEDAAIKSSEVKKIIRPFVARNITRLKSVKPLENIENGTAIKSSSNFVRRIKPSDLLNKEDDEERIKLSETTISENYRGTVANLPEDAEDKPKRRKIIRRLRPNKDAIYSESKKDNEEEEEEIKDIGQNFKNRLRARPLFSKSESTDILRTGLSGNETEDDDQTITTFKPPTTLSAVENATNRQEITIEEVSQKETDKGRDRYVPTKRLRFLDTVATTESSSTIRNRNVIRKFRPTFETGNVENNNRVGNRTRKIIRRLRPAGSATIGALSTETSTLSSSTVSTTVENVVKPAEEEITTTVENILEEQSDFSTASELESESLTTTLSDNTFTEDSETTLIPETTTILTSTPSTSPRPTRPSLIGRSRPAYRPRGRGSVDINRSTTPSGIQNPISFRRRLNRPGASTTEGPAIKTEEDLNEDIQATEDGVIDDKLKKLYNKKLNYTPIMRSTTERLKASTEEEKQNEEIESTTHFVETTTPENIVTTISTEDLIVTTTLAAEIIDETTILLSTEKEIPVDDTSSGTTSEMSVQETTEFDKDNNDILTEIPTTELPGMEVTTIESNTAINENNIFNTTTTPTVTENIEQNSTAVISTTESIISINNAGITNETIDTEQNLDENAEQDKTYKPIRYKPSDRPKLRIKLNRTETDKQDADEPRNSKFTPSRTLAQRNRNRLAYRKETSTESSEDGEEKFLNSFAPKGRKLERPLLGNNQIKVGDSEIKTQEIANNNSNKERGFYPTLKPVSERFNFGNKNLKDEEVLDDIEDDERYAEDEEEEEVEKENEEEEEEPVGQIVKEELKPIENPVIKYLQSIRNNQEIIRVNAGDLPEEIADGVQDDEEENDEEEKEDVEDNPKLVQVINRPQQPHRVVNRPQYVPNRPVRPSVGLRPITGNVPNVVNTPNLPNRPVGATPTAPAAPSAPGASIAPTSFSNGNRNYSRRFNKPVAPSPTVITTTEISPLAGINLEAVNARNKNLYSSKNRKVNIPHPGPVVANSSIESTDSNINVTNSTEIVDVPVTEENAQELTTELLSTLHHVFAEPEILETTSSSLEITTASVDFTTKYNFTAAQLEAARSLERLIEVNRIVEVSFKEDKVKNNAGLVESKVTLSKVPTLDRVGAINRVTVIKVVDGLNETTYSDIPSNHQVTLNEIITGRKLDIDNGGIDVVAQLHAPGIDVTKMVIFNNTLEIIKHEKSTASTLQTEEAPKFEIFSRSNVIDYSHRDLDPNQVIASAVPANQDGSNLKDAKQIAIDYSKSVVNSNNPRPVFNEPTTLPLEALFQTDPPDINGTKNVSINSEEPENDVSDDQDLLESRNHNGRVRIRILGEDNVDNDYKTLEKVPNPMFAPIRVLKAETVTLKADVVEVTQKPDTETIKIAPIEVSLSNNKPVIRVESSSSQIPKREISNRYFNPAVIFGEDN